MAEPDIRGQVNLTFDGKLAALGKMHLYEFSRAQYAFSRLITIVERYRRSGYIVDRITASQRVDLIVTAPARGSFRLDVDVDTTASSTGEIQQFDALFAVVLDKLIPRAEEFSELVEILAKIKAAEHRNGQVTGLPFSDEDLVAIRHVARGDAAAPQVLVRLLNWAATSPNRAIARAGITQDQIDRALRIASSDLSRRRLIDEMVSDYSADQIDKLVGRVRPIFNELAVPLGQSASEINIGRGSDRDGFYYIDKARLGFINARTLDEEEVELPVKIKNFDRESGTGSVRSDEFSGIKRFAVDPSLRALVQPKVITAMHKHTVNFECAVYTDSNGIITSYLVRDVVD